MSLLKDWETEYFAGFVRRPRRGLRIVAALSSVSISIATQNLGTQNRGAQTASSRAAL